MPDTDKMVMWFFAVGLLAAWITLSVYAANIKTPELRTVDGTVATVDVTVMDWRSKSSKVREAFRMRTPGSLYVSSFTGSNCRRARYMKCDPRPGSAIGPDSSSYNVMACRKSKRECKSRTRTSWRHPHVRITGTVTATVEGVQRTIPFDRFVPVNPVDGEDIMPQASAHMLTIGDTITMRYYAGHDDVIAVDTDPVNPKKKERNEFIAGAVICALAWAFVCGLLYSDGFQAPNP